jgi:hypothetical protein
MKAMFISLCLLLASAGYAADSLNTDCTPLSVHQTRVGALVYCQETVSRGDSKIRFFAIDYGTGYNPAGNAYGISTYPEVRNNQFLLMMEAVSHGKKLNIGFWPDTADEKSDCYLSNCRMIRSVALLK